MANKIEKMNFFGFALGVMLFSCQSQGNKPESSLAEENKVEIDYKKLDTATFAGGCFWCVEASFEQIEGVVEAISGYTGGKEQTASYELVSSGRTRHAEAVQIYYDPNVIDYGTLLDIFFLAHDPTQLNRQGPDVGTQYRSEIFFHNAAQQAKAVAKIEKIASKFDRPVVTKVSELEGFYKAEDYHQDYEKNHPNNPYIMNVSRPKIQKVAKVFKGRLKK